MNELDKLCSPSYWNKRLSPDGVIHYHLTFIKNASDNTRSKIPHQLDIAYGNTERQKYDIFGTDLNDDAPILIFLHGGYWQEPSITKSSYHFIAQTAHDHQIKTIFLGYDLCPQVTIPQIVRQIETASLACLQYATAHESKGVYFMGHSAGAHLVASLFRSFIKTCPPEQEAIVKGAILCSGVYNLEPLQKSVINELLKLDEGEARQSSPVKQEISDGAGIEFCVIVGRHESPEFIKQSMEFNEKLKKLGFSVDFAIIEGVDHFDILEKIVDDDYVVTKRIIELITK